MNKGTIKPTPTERTKPIDETQTQIEERVKTEKDPVTTSGWMQLHSLVEHIRHMTMKLVGRESSQSAAAALYLVNCFVSFAYHYYDAFYKSLNADGEIKSDQHKRIHWQHQAIEKLCNDWEALNPLLYAVKDPSVRVLETLVRGAKPSEDWATRWVEEWAQTTTSYWDKTKQQVWEDWAQEEWGDEKWELGVITVPYYGRHFELVRFDYAPHVSVTGVPIYNLATPWDWHVVWHEMAGQVVRQLEKIEGDEETNRIEQEILPALPEDTWETWRKKYYYGISGDEDALAWDGIDKAGWIAELLEDGYGVLSLGSTMRSALQSVLRQHYEDDDALGDERHPPPRLRFDMAGAMLLEMNFGPEKLKELGLTDEEIKACKDLQPVAEILYRTLAEYVRQVFDPSRTSEIDKLKDELLARGNIDKASIPALIAAVRLAFEEQPQDAKRIADNARRVIRSMSVASQTAKEITPPPDEYFKKLVEGKEWGELLSKSFQKTDLAVHKDNHTKWEENLWLRGFYLHKNWHWLWHGTASESHRW